MKELSIEEKAKAYDKALTIARDFYNSTEYAKSHAEVKATYEAIFPELAESEDERIRREIIDYLSTADDKELIPYKSWIAWLEKQGEQKLTPIFRIGDTIIAKDETYMEKEPFHIDWIEDDCYWDGENTILICDQDEFEIFEQQKPVDTVEPKFHEGDWVVSPNGVYWHIDKISNNRYEVTSNTGESSNWPLDTKIYHRFTIQDAKNGDVLNSVRVQATIIFKGFADDGKHILAYCALQKGFFLPQELPWDRDFEPVSEYWKNALYDAMTAKGYEWNAKKKELRKIEQKPIDDVKVLNQEFWRGYKYGEEQRFGKYADCNIEEMPVEWSEEDEGWLDNAIVSCEQCGNTDTADWLKSLKERIQPQPKQEWSEEDEITRNALINLVEMYYGGCIDKTEKNRLLSFLKSLRPQSQWKPSEEQIKSLKWLLDKIIYYPIGGHSILVVQKLLEQLKAL